MSRLQRVFDRIRRLFTETIWLIDETPISSIHRILHRIYKICMLSFYRFFDDRIMTKAAALTYSTLFAIVPILALVFAIAKGFGFENIVTNLLQHGIIGESSTVDMVINFINSYLQYAQSGLFIGIGLLFLLFSVYSLADNIEVNLNRIWQQKHSRRMGRKITDYFSLILLIPIGIICMSGLSVFASQTMTRMTSFELLGGFMQFLIKVMPYLITGLILTGFYIFMPNTTVKFRHAVIPGFLAGILFQILQMLYFRGQLSLSSYNAIYGGFAAIPLFLFWCNISWAIVLFGCELSYISQNVDHFVYYKERGTISRQHRDYYALMVLSCICKRFAAGEPALSTEELAIALRLPIRTVNTSLNTLTEAGLVESVQPDESEKNAYAPAKDIHLITVSYALDALYYSGFKDIETAKGSSVGSSLEAINAARTRRTGGIWDKLLSDL